MAILNATYVNIYQTVKRGFATEARLRKAIEEYNKCKEQRNKRVAVAKVAGEENAKLVLEKVELLKKLEAQQVNVQGLRQNLHT